MNRFGRAVLVCALSALCAAAAHAQIDRTVNPHFVLKGGIFAPGTSQGRDVGSTWLEFGGEYLITNPDAKGVLSLEGLYTSKSRTKVVSGLQDVYTKIQLTPIAINYRWRAVPANYGGGNVFFYGGGFGPAIVRVEETNPNPGTAGNIDERKTIAAINLFAGYEFSENVQLELKYHNYLSRVGGRKLDGLDALVGVKF